MREKPKRIKKVIEDIEETKLENDIPMELLRNVLAGMEVRRK